jgi:hypothetical protein
MLRTGRVSVVIRRPYTTAGMGQLERDPVGQRPVGKVQLDRDQLFARDRHSTEKISYVYKYQLVTQVE